jgi:hypothetical protein
MQRFTILLNDRIQRLDAVLQHKYALTASVASENMRDYAYMEGDTELLLAVRAALSKIRERAEGRVKMDLGTSVEDAAVTYIAGAQDLNMAIAWSIAQGAIQNMAEGTTASVFSTQMRGVIGVNAAGEETQFTMHFSPAVVDVLKLGDARFTMTLSADGQSMVVYAAGGGVGMTLTGDAFGELAYGGDTKLEIVFAADGQAGVVHFIQLQDLDDLTLDEMDGETLDTLSQTVLYE